MVSSCSIVVILRVLVAGSFICCVSLYNIYTVFYSMYVRIVDCEIDMSRNCDAFALFVPTKQKTL
jgi:hypothetical protein